ncbi:MAG TPA: alpha/beta hydrolase [Sneathiellales bacterium]|nr:alpha/beta hydrolase [Sneathiellales bacterium]
MKFFYTPALTCGVMVGSRLDVRLSCGQYRCRWPAEKRGERIMGTTHQVSGGGGTAISVYECGNPDGQAIFLIHGFAQSCLSWKCQFDSALADEFRIVAMDLRGHGMSEKPQGLEHYSDGQCWSDDVEAVIGQLKLEKPVLAGWSYGGFVVSDYIKRNSDGAIGAINFVGAAGTIGTDDASRLIGPGIMDLVPGLMCEELAENIAATRQFILNCTIKPPSDEELEMTLAYNMMTPPRVRTWMFSREEHFGDALTGVTVPTLVTHGTLDTVVYPDMAEIFLGAIPGAQKSFYDGIGHAPFIEDPERFNRELGALARSVVTN